METACTDRNYQKLLRAASWMQLLPTTAADRVVEDAFETSHQAKDVVARKGEPVHSWVGVAEGLLKVSSVTHAGKVVMFTGVPQGCWVGEGSVIKFEMRRYDITAMRPSRVIHIPRATFHWLLATNLDFNHFIIAHLNERVGQFLAMTEASRSIEPVKRVAAAISCLFNPVLYPGAGPLLQISQEEIGELAGLSRPTANQTIKELQERGLVRAEYGSLLVLDLGGLRSIKES